MLDMEIKFIKQQSVLKYFNYKLKKKRFEYL